MARILAKGIVPHTVGRSCTSINVLMVTPHPPPTATARRDSRFC